MQGIESAALVVLKFNTAKFEMAQYLKLGVVTACLSSMKFRLI
jgi:hypothetical protein